MCVWCNADFLGVPCPFRVNPVPASGSTDAGMVVIGRNPGEMENLKGEPFVGPAGEMLTKMLLALSIKREDVYITNLVKCFTPRNEEPSIEQISMCCGTLNKELEECRNARFIFLMGGLVVKCFLPESVLSFCEGQMFKVSESKFLIPLAHPSRLLRDEQHCEHVFNKILPELELVILELRSHFELEI